jgi:hypothetical protein
VRFISERARWRALVVAVALLSMTVLVTNSAGAAVNDDFAAVTTDGCGVAQFKDYGAGAPGGGNNDDYMIIHDYCADGHGVRANLYVTGYPFWVGEYNGNGAAGRPGDLGSVHEREREGRSVDLRGGVPRRRAG